jgi:hypothetical protein
MQSLTLIKEHNVGGALSTRWEQLLVDYEHNNQAELHNCSFSISKTTHRAMMMQHYPDFYAGGVPFESRKYAM